jgi:hypothetical protein
MINKKDDIKSLAEGFFAPDVENKIKTITIETFRAAMKKYVVNDETAQKFLEQIENCKLDVDNLDKDNYTDGADFLGQFEYKYKDGCVDGAYQWFKNAKDIMYFADRLDDVEDNSNYEYDYE